MHLLPFVPPDTVAVLVSTLLTNYEPPKIAPRRPIFPDEEEEMPQKTGFNSTASKKHL